MLKLKVEDKNALGEDTICTELDTTDTSVPEIMIGIVSLTHALCDEMDISKVKALKMIKKAIKTIEPVEATTEVTYE